MIHITISFPDNEIFNECLKELGIRGTGTYLKFDVSNLGENTIEDVAMWVDILGGISREPNSLLFEGLKNPPPPDAKHIRRGVVDLYALRASLELMKVQIEANIKHLEFLEHLRNRHQLLETQIAESHPVEVNNEQAP
jgi:hypothetical protein